MRLATFVDEMPGESNLSVPTCVGPSCSSDAATGQRPLGAVLPHRHNQVGVPTTAASGVDDNQQQVDDLNEVQEHPPLLSLGFPALVDRAIYLAQAKVQKK